MESDNILNQKKLVGEKAAEYIEDGMVVGLGTGSTVYYTITKLAQLVKKGLSIRGIPTSVQTEEMAKKLGIPLATFKEIDEIDIAIDGADEYDPRFNLIKGGGGALLREKIIANAAKKFIVVATPDKRVEKLGQFPLPVEVVPFGAEITKKQLLVFGCEPQLRQYQGGSFKTDNGNFILDCRFGEISRPQSLAEKLNRIPGVVEHGLFIDRTDILITLDQTGSIIVQNPK
ncbi:ribose 5-phosphate isomerase A [Bacillus sp. B-jedd]|nr:ribose 5-phosphate isomerase A [Bacillus sp. B-jedd]